MAATSRATALALMVAAPTWAATGPVVASPLVCRTVAVTAEAARTTAARMVVGRRRAERGRF
jgi:hypothetical protein